MKKIVLVLFSLLFFLTDCSREAKWPCTMQEAPVKIKICVPPDKVTLQEAKVKIFNGSVMRSLVISTEGFEKEIEDIRLLHDFDFDHPNIPDTTAPLEYSLQELFPNLSRRNEVKLRVEAIAPTGRLSAMNFVIFLK